jgi:hypothetical protein
VRALWVPHFAEKLSKFLNIGAPQFESLNQNGPNLKRVDYAPPVRSGLLRPCHYARSMQAMLLDDGVGDTLVSLPFDDVAFISPKREEL